jgi:hypothetical protein
MSSIHQNGDFHHGQTTDTLLLGLEVGHDPQDVKSKTQGIQERAPILRSNHHSSELSNNIPSTPARTIIHQTITSQKQQMRCSAPCSKAPNLSHPLSPSPPLPFLSVPPDARHLATVPTRKQSCETRRSRNAISCHALQSPTE